MDQHERINKHNKCSKNSRVPFCPDCPSDTGSVEPTLEELRIYLKYRSFEIVIGSGFIGNFVYIPTLGFGFATDDLSDTEQNRVHLTDILSYDDACAVASALREYVTC